MNTSGNQVKKKDFNIQKWMKKRQKNFPVEIEDKEKN